MSEILLVDFGASRIKTVLFDTEKVMVIDREECISPSVKSSSPFENRFEIPVEEYWKVLLGTAGAIINRHPKKHIKQMWICSEMHGFVLTDLKGHAITPYISWKDQRANFDIINGVSTFSNLRSCLYSFRKITGMKLKPGLAVVTLASLARSGSIPELMGLSKSMPIRVLSLVDWLLFRGGEVAPKASITLAAGLGIYDIDKRDLSREILEHEYLSGLKIHGLDLQEEISSAIGRIRIFDSEISVFGGIGDFQAAIGGSDIFGEYDAVLNLGTGSQVAVRSLDEVRVDDSEVRIMANGSYLNVITHIPCGRALNVFAAFLDEFSVDSGGRRIFWEKWSSLSTSDIVKSRLHANVAVFESAWGREISPTSNGTIGIDEGVSSIVDVLAGIAKSWLLQYQSALHIIDPLIKAKKVAVSGGVARNSSFVLSSLRHLMPERHFYMPKTLTGEETFDGLLQLAVAK